MSKCQFFNKYSNRDIPEEKKIEKKWHVRVTFYSLERCYQLSFLLFLIFLQKGQMIQATLAQKRELSPGIPPILRDFCWGTSSARVEFTDHEILM